MYQDVTTGNSIACFEDHPVMQYAIKQGTKLKIVTKPALNAPYGFAVKKGHNQALLKAFNTGLEDLKASGTYDTIKAKYLGSDEIKTAAKTSGNSAEDRTFIGLIKQNQGALLSGLKETLWLTVVSIFFATIFGVLVGLMGVVPNKFSRGTSTTLIYLFRGMPLLVLALFIYTGIPSLTGQKIPAFVAGVITLTFNEGAYIAAFVKGGIEAVDPGQMVSRKKFGIAIWKIHEKNYFASGNQDHGAIIHQPVYYYFKGYLNPIDYRVVGT